jgi:hypothetical protein
MQEERNNSIPQNGGEENVEKNEQSGERFESDTQKIVRRHLEDPDHVITEEEMKNIRVGMSPPLEGEIAYERIKNEDLVEEEEERLIGDTDDIEKSNNEKDSRVTPWDTIDPD